MEKKKKRTAMEMKKVYTLTRYLFELPDKIPYRFLMKQREI